MCGGRETSIEQFNQSEIDLQSDSTASDRNEFKRPRPVNSSLKPPLPPSKKRQVALAPPPQSQPTCTTLVPTEAAENISTDSASNSKAPPGVFDFPMPKPGASMFDIGQFYDVFFKSLVEDGTRSSKPIVLEGFRPIDEILDPDMERIWLPILRQPLIPIVYKQKRFRF